MRDYFYDEGMHGVDWPAMHAKYLPLVERVSDRSELGDVISEMVGELSTLHIFVRFGDEREAPDQIKTASLGARLARDEAAGGWRVEHIFGRTRITRTSSRRWPARASRWARAT